MKLFLLLILMLSCSNCTSDNVSKNHEVKNKKRPFNLARYILSTKQKDDYKVVSNKNGFSIKESESYFQWKNLNTTSFAEGNYWVSKVENPVPIFLQAPHRFHDQHTGSILKKMLLLKNFAVASTNSLHRYKKNILHKKSNFDLAHTKDTLFLKTSNLYSKDKRAQAVVQLHGYSPKNRKSSLAKRADFIISSGKRSPNLRASKIDSCLKISGFKSLLYGKEVFELGGTQNIFSKLGSADLKKKFVHIEINKLMRNKLNSNKKLLVGFANCIVK